MANGGWYGTREEWERIERPLVDTDSILDKFSAEVELSPTKNYKDWPERSFTWYSNGVRCLIQLYLVDEKNLKFNLWLCASIDRDGNRYWKYDTPIKEQTFSEFQHKLADELRSGYQRLIDWSRDPDRLEQATTLA